MAVRNLFTGAPLFAALLLFSACGNTEKLGAESPKEALEIYLAAERDEDSQRILSVLTEEARARMIFSRVRYSMLLTAHVATQEQAGAWAQRLKYHGIADEKQDQLATLELAEEDHDHLAKELYDDVSRPAELLSDIREWVKNIEEWATRGEFALSDIKVENVEFEITGDKASGEYTAETGHTMNVAFEQVDGRWFISLPPMIFPPDSETED